MTRGKEVQDLIKANKKSAREMFEEAGYKYGKDYLGDIQYRFADEEFTKVTTITFELKHKKYSIRCFGNYYDYCTIDMNLHKLITYQLQELRWL